MLADIKRNDAIKYSFVQGEHIDAVIEQIILDLKTGNLISPDAKLFFVMDHIVDRLYGKNLRLALDQHCFKYAVYVFEAGEHNKSLETYTEILNAMNLAGMTRKDCLIGFGGGVVGDLAGFVASTYMRGIDFILVPTTLLAMIDSAIGGKTAVNTKSAKNSVGSFYSPRWIYVSSMLLRTLPWRRLKEGIGEVIKTCLVEGVLGVDKVTQEVHRLDEAVREVVDRRSDGEGCSSEQSEIFVDAYAREIDALIEACILFKSAIVAMDPKESYERGILNFGHSIGHAVEKLFLDDVFHGEAVAYGMKKILEMGYVLGITQGRILEDYRDIIHAWGLEATVEAIETRVQESVSVDALMAAIKLDKKASMGSIRLVALDNNRPVFIEVALETLEELMGLLCKSSVSLEGLDVLKKRFCTKRVLPVPGGRALGGRLKIPSSKSLSHRALICASLAEGLSTVSNVMMSEDLIATSNALRQLGAVIEPVGDDTWRVQGICAESFKAVSKGGSITIEANESGSTLRFLIPIASACCNQVRFVGRNKLVDRPLGPFLKWFDQQGVPYTYNNQLPLEVSGHLHPDTFELEGNISSQFISGMLMAAPLMQSAPTKESELGVVLGDMKAPQGQDVVVKVTGPFESKAYVDLTLEVMEAFGVTCQVEDENTYRVSSESRYGARSYHVEGDYSQAAFWIVAGLLAAPEEGIVLSGLNPESSQGDRVIVDLVQAMGGRLQWQGSSLYVYRSETCGIEVDASQCPDIIPVLGVLGAFSKGQFSVVNGSRLRIKESDRIAATCSELRKLGATIEEYEDGFKIIRGIPIESTRQREAYSNVAKIVVVDGWNDHRIVMALAIAGLKLPYQLCILGANAVHKSYPHFFEDYARMGGICSE